MTWRVQRDAAPGSGPRRCTLISLGGNVTVRLRKQGPETPAVWSVAVGFDNQPGSVRYLRIDRKYFTTAGDRFHGPEAAEIVARLKVPGEFAFEWIKRPTQVKQQGLFGTGDFAAKAARCERWVEGNAV